MIINDEKKLIRYVSQSYVGKAHDYSLLKTVFPPDQAWFKDFTVRLDLGFQGFAKDYRCKELYLPNKKPKGGVLAEVQKEENRQMARQRIPIEHSIGGMKRFRILSGRLRVHDFDLYDDLLGICAGLWNLYLKNE